jgi:hypothetical protein
MSFLPNLARAARRSNRLAIPRTQIIPQRLASSTTPAVKFTSPTTEHVSHLRTLLSSKSSLLSTLDESASNEELDGFNVDWMGKYKGQSRVVVKPKNTQEVADVMKYCYEQGIAIVPQGGNTGLVGTFCSSRPSMADCQPVADVQVDQSLFATKSYSPYQT